MSRLEAEFRRVRSGDAEELADNLREADAFELKALGVTDPRSAVRESLAVSTLSAAVVDQQGLVALLGVAPLSDSVLTPIGAPWMLGVERSRRHVRTLARYGPAYTRAMLAAYPRLRNIVHADNALHIGWLQRLGFRFAAEPVVIPSTGARFLAFEMSV